MNLSDETLIRFDDTVKNICINFTQTIFQTAKTKSCMLMPCQCFLPADTMYPPYKFLHGKPVNRKSHKFFYSQIFPTLLIIQGLLFFALFYTCKVDTYFQKTKTMLYEKM